MAGRQQAPDQGPVGLRRPASVRSLPGVVSRRVTRLRIRVSSSRLARWVGSHDILTFYCLAFASAWLGWIPSLLASLGAARFQHPAWHLALLLPAAGPAAAAVATDRLAGRAPPTFADRWARLAPRVAPLWYAVALAGPVLLLAANAALSPGAAGNVPAGSPPPARALATVAVLSLLANPWEEVGWRGFALRRLQTRWHPLLATLAVGSLWAAWHLPIFFVATGPIAMAGIPALPWTAYILAHSFVVTWLFNSTRQSVLVVALFHVAMNIAGAFFTVPSYGVLAGLELAIVLGLMLATGPTLRAPMPQRP